MTRLLSVLAIAVAVLAARPAAAQFNMARGNSEQIQVYADEGIEWQSEASRVIARGNAKAVRGRVTVTADQLTAYYRNGADGDEIWRLDADGSVTIFTDSEKATGSKATYDLDKAIFVLRGQPPRLVTPTEDITASDTLEYWEAERMAVARGDAVAVHKDKADGTSRTLKGDVLTAHFKDGKTGDMELKRADAYGNVVLISPKEQIVGDRGDYNLETGIATVTGSVKITRDGNELTGGYAHVNMNTGISKLFGTTPGKSGPGKSGPGQSGDGRVRGVFTPEKNDGDGRKAVFQGAGPRDDAGKGDAGKDGTGKDGAR